MESLKLLQKRETFKVLLADYKEVCEKLNIKQERVYSSKINNADLESNIDKIIKKEMFLRFKKATINKKMSEAKYQYILNVINILADMRIFASINDIKRMANCENKRQVIKIKEELGGISW